MSNLINELRTFANAGFPIADRAADHIEAQDRRIAELESTISVIDGGGPYFLHYQDALTK